MSGIGRKLDLICMVLWTESLFLPNLGVEGCPRCDSSI